jgi:DNA-binding protein YbaB
MRNFQKLVAVLALSGMCLAAPVPSDGEPAAKKSTKHHAAKAAQPVMKDDTADKLRQLKETVDQQQAAMQQMQQQLQQTQQQLQKTQQQLSQTQAAADAKVAAIEANTNMQVQKVQADVSDVKAAVAADTMLVQKDAKKIEYLEHPGSIAYKGVTFTPGGQFELLGFYRTHATMNGDATAGNSIPLAGQVNGSYNTRLSEFAMQVRNSRLALRMDGKAGSTKLTGQFEWDFEAAGTGSNPNQTSGWAPRVRQAYAKAEFKNGLTIMGGQPWTLITMNRKGTDASTFWTINSVDQQTMPGIAWGRWAELRLSQQVGKSVSVALALDMPSYLSSATNANTTYVSGVAVAGATTLNNSVIATCATLPCNDQNTYSTGLAPDLVFKAAYDNDKLGHYEVRGVTRFFRDRVVSTATVPGWNNTGLGWGVGGGAIIPVVPNKKLDFLFQGLYGKGISRYQSAGQYDFVIQNTTNDTWDHNMIMVKGASAMVGFESHPNNNWEINFDVGGEYYGRTTYPASLNTTTGVFSGLAGYGIPIATNTGCYFETVPSSSVSSTCTGNNRLVGDAKFNVYYDLFKGPYGKLTYGAEINYYMRGTWSGNGGLTTAALPYFPAGTTSLAPRGNDKVVMGVMRYYIP